MAAMLVLVASIASMPALAASNGIYLATATPHYKHPVSGVIEDSGGDGSAVLGQSMTESATYKQALVEVDPQGNTYVTICLQVMDNIKDPQFQVDGKTVSATLMQESYGSLSAENTADYCMKVNSENSIIRCNMFVIAMGREVIFYITVSNLQPGSGNFITTVKVEDPKPPVVDPPVSDASPVSIDPVTPDTSNVPSEPSPDTTYDSSSDTTSDKACNSDSGSSDVTGLQEFDKPGSNVSTENESGESEKSNGPLVWWIVGGVVVLAAAGGCVWYFVSYRKKK